MTFDPTRFPARRYAYTVQGLEEVQKKLCQVFVTTTYPLLRTKTNVLEWIF